MIRNNDIIQGYTVLMVANQVDENSRNEQPGSGLFVRRE